METRVHANLKVAGNVILASHLTAFPENPEVGTMVIKDQSLYAYIKIGGLTTWYPLSSRTRSYIHTQGLPSTTWTVTHNLGSTDIWSQVKDSTNTITNPKITAVDVNTVSVQFTSAETGTVLIVVPDDINVPQVSASVITVGNENVLIDSSGVRVNGSYVLTSANISADIANAVAAEATLRMAADKEISDTLLLEVTARTNADATLTSSVGTLTTNLNNEITARTNADATLTTNLNNEITARTNADATLTSSVGTLTTNLNNEITARTNADATLTTNLNNEITARTNADKQLLSLNYMLGATSRSVG